MKLRSSDRMIFLFSERCEARPIVECGGKIEGGFEEYEMCFGLQLGGKESIKN